MSLRLRLLGYLGGLHLALFVLTFVHYRANAPLFVALEALLLASLAGGVHLVNRALEPLDYTQRFHDLLQDENYAARLKQGDSPELNELVQLFNRMLGALYQERLDLGEQRGFLERLLEATPSAVVVFDFDGRISLLNASALALLGLEHAKGSTLAGLQGEGAAFPKHVTGAERLRCQGLLAQLDALPAGASRLLCDPDGRRYRAQRGQFFDRGFARHFLFVEELTAELESSERATYEKLIRVLGHEVNNTVAATGSVLDSLLFYGPQLHEPDRGDFTTAIEAVKRRNVSLGDFIERFTRVVKMPEPELRPVSVRAMMDDILWLNREHCKSRAITIEWSRCDEVAPQPMDRQLMEQAMLNVVKNAVEAVQAAHGATGGYIRLALAREDGGARLSVIDSGNGIGEASARQLFTPFFSTRKGGQGIGLVFVREVLNRHGFGYRLAPNGQGETSFDIWFAGRS